MDGTLQLIINIGAVAIAITAVIGVPLAIVKFWPLLKRAVTIGESLEKLPEMAQELTALTIGQRDQAETLLHQNEQLATIKHEVEFNNGSSVKDAVIRTEKVANEVAEKLSAHLATPTTTVNVSGLGS